VLRDLESKIVSARDVEVARSVLSGEYNSEHLQAFHQHLFQDVYDWAGKFRTVDISKGDSHFANWRFLGDEVSAGLARLEQDSWLIGLSRSKFVGGSPTTTANSTPGIRSARGTAEPSGPSCGSWQPPRAGDWTGRSCARPTT
jgi:hypothetical protein